MSVPEHTLLVVTQEGQKSLLVPLRSNAHSLVAGPGVSAMRHRLKFASLVYDHIYLEQGRLRVTVGPTGSMEARIPDDPDVDFQSSHQRSTKRAPKFVLNIGFDDEPESMRTVIHSDATYRWDATLAPFARELPGGTDWVHWGSTSLAGEGKRLAAEWTRKDMESPALVRKWPDHIVRSALVKHVNHDLVVGAFSGLAISQDPLHRAVYESRYRLDSSWKPDGFVLPIVLPSVSGLSWQDIASLREHRGMIAFRRTLDEVEAEALREASDGDLESAAHHAFERFVASEAVAGKNSLSTLAKTHTAGLLFGGLTGALTLDWVGSIGFAGAVVVGQVPGFAEDVVRLRRMRRKPSWVSAYQAVVSSARG